MFSGKFLVVPSSLPGCNFIGARVSADEIVSFEGSYNDCLDFASKNGWYLNDRDSFCYLVVSKATYRVATQVSCELIN